MKHFAVAATVVLFFCGLCFGQNPPSNYEHLKIFNKYVGSWVKQGQLEEDMPFGNKGDVGTSTITWSWGDQKNYLDWRWDFNYEGKRSATKGIMTWDAREGKPVGHGVGFDGVKIKATVLSQDLPLKILAEFLAPDGSVRSHVETFALGSDDTMSITLTQRKGSPVTSDSPPFEFQRAASAAGPDIKMLSPLVGTWHVEFDWPGLPFDEAIVTYTWKYENKFLVASWKGMDGADLGPELFAIDPINKTVRLWGFDGGAFYEGIINIDGATWTGAFSGTRFTGERTTSTNVLFFKDPQTILLSHTPGGADEPTGSATFRRVKTRLGKAGNEIPKKALNELKFMLGKWETEMRGIDGQRGTSSHERRWAKGRHCLRMTWSAQENGGTVHAYGISGWNAEKRAVVEHWYDTAGRYTTVMWPLKDMNEDMWKGTGGRTYADGTVENGTCQLEKGDGQWVFTFAGQKNGEETGVRNVTKKVD